MFVNSYHWIQQREAAHWPAFGKQAGDDMMKPSRKSLILAGTAGLLSGAAPPPVIPEGRHAGDVAELVERSAEANAALMRGDLAKYRGLIGYSDDFTFLSPFGGAPSRRAAFTDERMEAIGRTFRNGAFKQELVQAYAADGLVVLVLLERQTVEVGGLPAQDWPLRVTLVYRRDGAKWRLAHRHADPLAKGISLEKAAALARGE
jgi:ketosteroid isomerase-like protein